MKKLLLMMIMILTLAVPALGWVDMPITTFNDDGTIDTEQSIRDQMEFSRQLEQERINQETELRLQKLELDKQMEDFNKLLSPDIRP